MRCNCAWSGSFAISGGPNYNAGVSSNSQRTLKLRTRLPLYLLAILAVLQIVEPDRAWTYLLAGLGTLLGLSYLWAYEMLTSVEIERSSQGAWVVAGDRLIERWQLLNRSSWPLLWATIRDQSNIPGYHIDRAVAAGSRSGYTWETEGVCTHRGVFTLGPWSVTCGDPFGLFEVQITFPEMRTLLVYPRVMRLPEIDLPRGGAGGASRQTRVANATTVLASHVRPYVPGESLHLIHWRKSAQLGHFMVKQFDLEPAGDLWILLDLDAAVQAGEGAESTTEYGVVLAASLAARHLAENRAVGLIAFGREMALVEPHPGNAQLWPLLRALAHSEPGNDWPLQQVLDRIAPTIGRGRTLVTITPSLDQAWVGELLRLKRRDIAAAVLLLDAASFAPAAAPPSLPLDAFCGLLADHGIPIHVIDRSYIFRPLIPIKRKRTVYKTLGTGRVVAVEVEEEV